MTIRLPHKATVADVIESLRQLNRHDLVRADIIQKHGDRFIIGIEGESPDEIEAVQERYSDIESDMRYVVREVRRAVDELEVVAENTTDENAKDDINECINRIKKHL